MKPSRSLLDLFGGAGGCLVGYQRSGFTGFGVDLYPQPRYPGEMFVGDAILALETLLDGKSVRFGGLGVHLRLSDFDAIHASPPCQAFTSLSSISDNEHPDLLTPTRELLEATGLPYVIENVVGAPMRRDYVLCGSMFGLGANCDDGVYRQLWRHRWFETNWPVGLQPECRHSGQPIGVYGGGTNRLNGIGRGRKGNARERAEAMGIDWMNVAEMSQAIPPAFSEFIGAALMQHLNDRSTHDQAPTRCA